jgi:type VI secretion system protein ImpI/type VI secretion system protein
MSTLSLTIFRGPEQVSGQQFRARGPEVTVGRGTQCDWVLPDPHRSLSRSHCRFELTAGSWHLVDLSANGTFVNTATQALGQANPHAVRNGDRLRMGDYEIEVRVQEAALAPPPAPAGFGLDSNPFASPGDGGFAGVRLPGLDDSPAPPAAYNPTAYPHAASPFAGAASDHAAAASDAFIPPAVIQPDVAAAPDDWFRSALLPTPRKNKPAVDLPFEAETPVAVPALHSPPHHSPPHHSPPHFPPPLHPPPAQQPAAAHAQPGAWAQSPAPAQGGNTLAALALLLKGAALPDDALHRSASNPEKVLGQAGGVLQAAVAGMRALLVARGLVKREFRIEQTMLRPKENNPLKFAASDEQALASLLDPRTDGVGAVAKAIEDLTTHEVAVLAATQAAARAMLLQLAPDALEADDPGGSNLLPGAREKRLWLAYKRRHATLMAQLEDDFESAFGTAFARAYEQAVESGGRR